MENKDKEFWRNMYQMAAMGMNLVAATFIGLFMGWAIDNWLTPKLNWHTSPWFTLIFLLFGIIAGFRNMFHMAKKAEVPDDPNQKKGDFRDKDTDHF
jgi:ATP synthase protein I